MKQHKYITRLSVFLTFTILTSLGVLAQIPAPQLYYDFEGDSGSEVIDKGENGYNGVVARPDSTTLGDEGAPAGPSPTTGASFSDGLIEVPDLDLSAIISSDGSYTLSAWLKPTDLNGDKFFFGQTSEGIHNGIRNNGFLHQAHWGADTNGATNLNDYLNNDDDGWIHAAWTYDGDSDTGRIYLDGQLDWEGNKRAPNGSGSLIIGGRNGGGNGYVGLADEIAVWEEVLDDAAIELLASGASPFNQEDDDEDGLPDFYEERLVDNLEDLNGNVDGPGPGSGTGDFDGDGLSDLDEYEETRTDPTKKDTDGDGLNDNVETNTGEWVSINSTGTDPLNSDSDNDTLADGVENPDLPYNEDDPEDQPGTDPNKSDTDGDGSPDGRELVLETNPTVSDQPDIEGYVNSFEGYADGTTDLGDGSVIAGAAASIVEGRLQLTIDNQGLGYSSFSIPAIEGSSNGFRITFDYELNDSPGANDPADGFSINYGDATLGELGGAEEGMVGPDSKAVLGGVTENLSFEVDTWRNGDAEQGLNISGVGEGSDLGQLAFENGIVLEDGSRKEGTIEIQWNPQLGASFKTTGMTTNADFSEVDTSAFTASEDHNFIISARVGGANQDLFIDNLVIEVGIFDGDEDGDGLPDFYENEFAGNLTDLNGNEAGPGPGAGTGDFDGDGLTDLDEYEETSTNPIKADTDGDGLSDGVETNTGTYVSATNTGTDPKKSDTDKDGLADGVESNTGELVDEENTGTDPNNADTDGDGYADGGEIIGGTDPNDENSKGALPFPYLYLDFEGEVADSSGNGNDGVVDGNVTFDVDGADLGPTPTTGASFNGGHLDFPSIDMNSMINNFEDGSYTFACWMKPIGSAGGEGFMWGQTNQGIHNGIRNGGLLHSAHWGADWNASTVLEADQWVHAVWTYDGAIDEATIYVNGVVDGGPTAQRAPNGGGTFIFGARNNGENSYNGHVDDIAIWREVLPEAAIEALADGVSPIGATQEDEDGDGLPDAWEEKLVDNLDDLNGNASGPGPGAGTGDFDGDGLTDLDEYEETKTNPTKADTDGDGLSDGVETNTGTYVSATNTGTNPKKADTDKDGLTDGVETNTGKLVDAENTGTDPNNPDSDGDGYFDGGEMVSGTNPNDKNSKGTIPAPVLYLDFESEATDMSGNDYVGDVNNDVTFDVEGADRGPTPTAGASFNGGYINFPDVDLTSIIQDTDGENSYTFSAWIKPSDLNGDKFLFGQTSQGIHNGIRGGGFLHQAHWGADNNGATNLSTLEGEWVHAAWTYDGLTDTAKMYLNGVLDADVNKRAPNGNGNLIVGGRNGGSENYLGMVDDVAFWTVALSEGSIQALADGVSPIGASQVSFEFTNIIYNAEEDGFRLEWNSKPNKTYALFFSETLEEFDADIDDSIESQGETTVYPGEGEWLPNPLDGAPRLFFRIEENQ